VESYPRCSIYSKKEPVKSCLPYREMVSEIDQFFYPTGVWELFLTPLGPSDLEFPCESELIVCRSSSPCACDSSLKKFVGLGQNLHCHMEYGQFASPFGMVDPPHSCDFSDFKFPLDEAILETMTTVYIPWEYLHCGF
jgi:hypothetical protein